MGDKRLCYPRPPIQTPYLWVTLNMNTRSISGALSPPLVDQNLKLLTGFLPRILSILGDTTPNHISSVGYDVAYEVENGTRCLLVILEYPRGVALGCQAKLTVKGGGQGRSLVLDISTEGPTGYKVSSPGFEEVRIFPVGDLLIPGVARIIAKVFDFGDPELPPTDGERHYRSFQDPGGYCCPQDCCYGISMGGVGHKIQNHTESCRAGFLRWEQWQKRKADASSAHQRVLHLLKELSPEDRDFVFKSIREYQFTPDSSDPVGDH